MVCRHLWRGRMWCRCATALAIFLSTPLVSSVHAQTITITDINPSGTTNSAILAVSGTTAVGGNSFSQPTMGSSTHALVWDMHTTGSLVDLNPTGFESSQAVAVSGTTVVGTGEGQSTLFYDHALLWNGTAAGAVDLNPANYYLSYGTGVSGNMVIGYGQPIGNYQYQVHALLWDRTAGSMVDLNPSNYDSSQALSISDGVIFGGGALSEGSGNLALMWTGGTAASFVNITPAGYQGSLSAYGRSGSTYYGYGSKGATIWTIGPNGTSTSLTPTGYSSTFISGMANGMEVGYGYGQNTGGYQHAMLWTGSAASAVDLNAFLPAGYNTQSFAEGITADGDIYGYGSGLSGTHSFLWHVAAAPEPSQAAALAVGTLGLAGLWGRARKRKA